MNLEFREATQEDIEAIVGLLVDDDLGKTRERLKDRAPSSYTKAFNEFATDANNELIVVMRDSEIIGTFQLTFIPSLTHQGGMRAQIEGVRVKRTLRGQGIGRAMFEWVIARAKERGCRLVQLTSDKRRAEAHRFYGSLGFKDSHVGYKLSL